MTELAHAWQPPTEPGSPLVLALHGTGGHERDLLDLARALAPGAGVVAPRGPVVEGDGVPRFFRRIATGGDGAYPFRFDDAEIAARAEQLAAFLAGLAEREGLAGAPVHAVGFSNGANMAAAMLLLAPGTIQGAALFAPMPVLADPPPTALDDVAVWLGGGRADPIAGPAEVEAVADLLRTRGAAVEVAWHDGGHEIRPEAARAAKSWMAKLRAASGEPGLP